MIKKNFLSIVYIIVPVIIFLSSTLFIFLKISNETDAFTQLTSYSHSATSKMINNSLLVSFRSEENNIGIISIPFQPKGVIRDMKDTDSVTFKIKEEDQSKYIHQSTIPAKYFYLSQNNVIYGFPPIADSQNKTYEVLISPNTENAQNVINTRDELVVDIKYFFSSDSITESVSSISEFLYKKVLNVLGHALHAKVYVVFYTPFIMYFIWFIFFRNYKSVNMIIIFTYIGLIPFVLFFNSTQNIFVWIYSLIWIAISLLFSLKSEVTFWICGVLFLMSCIIMTFGVIDGLENISLILFNLLVWGIILYILEVNNVPKRITKSRIKS